MKRQISILFAAWCMMAGAVTVSNVTVSQDRATRVVRVTYSLDETAIVTLGFSLGGEAIPEDRVISLSGAVNRRVSVGTHEILWYADKDWPGHVGAVGDLSAVVSVWSLQNPPDYMVVDLRCQNTANRDTVSYYASSNAIPFGVGNRLYKTDKLVLRRIPAAGVTWRMGAETGKWLSESNNPWHYVRFTADYYMGIYPVTMGQYYRIMNRYPTRAMEGFVRTAVVDADTHPVGGISYGYNSSDTQGDYLRKDTWPTSTGWSMDNFSQYNVLGKLHALTGVKFDLPTDAEWEYACRATTDNSLNTPGNQGHVSTSAEDGTCPYTDVVSWYAMNSFVVTDPSTEVMQQQTHPVGLKMPNTWGLYDMHGNVWEWCLDWYDTLAATSDPVENPTGAASGTQRIRRGGGYSSAPKYQRSSARSAANPTGNYANHGFRLRCPAAVE